MTTIAYRDGVFASDSSITFDTVHVGSVTKLYAINGHCIGSAGSRSEIVPFLEWIKRGFPWEAVPIFKEDKDAGFSAIVIDRKRLDKVQYFWLTDKGTLIADDIEAAYFAVGSGKHIALGAMAHGASAVDAVKCACKHDAYSRLPIEVMSCVDGLIEKSI